mmetsp:Transcript_647/g.1100  ORF Transcript_647/g.1100 Transcript_647/m.1100 type:complete len:171 (+) Transcript_647:105-617(+)|eukprot:CAMPEP_0203773784 /NCGR_PEP_ID=MMETSP0099_2-20121227/4872_1 /ASSEMBLY_ACC=CAM_ASM_000209 /TAXON_ID=96639 /ORGANISM=" , Strain NY0313808BC1" /LENGTH=170 /DNA_ID=CAMNT_0050671697 /DNA_START=42 /DNA_END=554 /DNA_ORIENTATION=+
MCETVGSSAGCANASLIVNGASGSGGGCCGSGDCGCDGGKGSGCSSGDEGVWADEESQGDIWEMGSRGSEDGGDRAAREREIRIMEERLNNLGFEEGVSETYSSESQANEDAFEKGLTLGFQEAVNSGRLLGRIRLKPSSPQPGRMQELYGFVQTGKFEAAQKLGDELLG